MSLTSQPHSPHKGAQPGPLTPVEIRRETEPGKEGVHIRWSDGLQAFISNRSLRESCPCATCEEGRGNSSHAHPLTPSAPPAAPSGKGLLKVLKSSVSEELNLKSISAVGNYAISLLWGDGHDSGIYSYRLLRDLSEKPSVDESEPSNARPGSADA